MKRQPAIRSTAQWMSIATAAACAVAMSVGAIAAQGRGGRAGGPPPPPVDPHELSGFWELPPDGHDGRNIPAAALVAGVTRQKIDAVAAHDAKAYRWCNNLGVPALMGLARPFDIRINSRFMIIVPEYGAAMNRWIYLERAKHIPADEFEPGINGDSIGHWEGNVLVTETTGFNPDRGILAIPGGGFKTAGSKLVERFRLLKNGAQLQVISTWTDPMVFRTPHTYEYRYNRLPRDYEARPSATCDPYDDERAQLFSGPPKITP
ncbi:MAG: hypothetical protein ABI652_06535 [Acidobacteriota bacterium]